MVSPHSSGNAVSYCGLTSAFRSSAGKEQRGPISKQRNAWLQTVLIEAAKLAPRWNPQLAALHARQLELGHANRATLQVARKLVAYLLAVDKSGQPFQILTPPPTDVGNLRFPLTVTYHGCHGFVSRICFTFPHVWRNGPGLQPSVRVEPDTQADGLG